MIGDLPTTLNVAGVDCPIRYRFKDCLTIMQAFEDDSLSNDEKILIMLDILYEEDEFGEDTILEAVDKAIWFLSQGNTQPVKAEKPLSRLDKDEQLIFAAVNEVAHTDIRTDDNMHYWTYLSYMQAISSHSLFASIVRIREKRNKGLKLEPEEKKFYKEHKEMIDLQDPTEEDKAFVDFINSIT